MKNDATIVRIPTQISGAILPFNTLQMLPYVRSNVMAGTVKSLI